MLIWTRVLNVILTGSLLLRYPVLQLHIFTGTRGRAVTPSRVSIYLYKSVKSIDLKTFSFLAFFHWYDNLCTIFTSLLPLLHIFFCVVPFFLSKKMSTAFSFLLLIFQIKYNSKRNLFELIWVFIKFSYESLFLLTVFFFLFKAELEI